jgi:hypothetical protein
MSEVLTDAEQARIKLLVNKLKSFDWDLEVLASKERRELAAEIERRLEED